ncbi:MAG: hypothetical protein GH144_01135 [Clostridia bacterium]|jgi:site-specific DNA-methyltransferase (adenine-specific)|nr:hypothetical protein [Clostridia bacterium]
MNKILAIRKEQLPDNIEGLKNFIIIGEGVLKAHRSQLNIIKKIGMAQDYYNYYNARLSDGQSVATIVLEAQGKLGKVLSQTSISEKRASSAKGTCSLPGDITKKESHIAQLIANNPGVVIEVIERAKDNREIPTTREVLEEIQTQAKEEKKQQIINSYLQKAEEYTKDDSIQILEGDFREVTKQFPDNHFDHIVTDPPYTKECLPLWSDLSRIGNRILKPGGFCVTYVGGLFLPEIFARLTENLEYFWMVILLHKMRFLVPAVVVGNYYQSVLIFQKAPKKKYVLTCDVIQPTPLEKGLHPWQKSEREMDELLEKFTHPGDLILDPFAGSGTTLVSCLKNKRRCIGIELEKENCQIIKGRLTK